MASLRDKLFEPVYTRTSVVIYVSCVAVAEQRLFAIHNNMIMILPTNAGMPGGGGQEGQRDDYYLQCKNHHTHTSVHCGAD